MALALKGPNPPPPEEFNLVRTFIAFMSCAQRKSTAENFTIQEFEEANRVEGGAEGDHWVVTIYHHKTAASRGPANLVLNEHLHSTMASYLEFRRGKGSNTNLLVKAYGESSKRLPDLVKRMGESFGVTPPTPTLHRKVVGTRAAQLPQGEQENVAGLMSHSIETQKRFYRIKIKEGFSGSVQVNGLDTSPNSPNPNSPRKCSCEKGEKVLC